MSTDKNISALVESQLPSFILEEAPLLAKFIKAYYESLEQDGQVTERSRNLLTYADIDTTTNEFLDWFKREILVNIPKNISTDERTFMKNVLSLYRSKGSEESYRLLFRALFDEEIEVFYPAQNILRVSDGSWNRNQFIRVSVSSGNGFSQGGSTVLGNSSGAQARVESIRKVREFGLDVFIYDLSRVNGTFNNDEILTSSDTDFLGTIYSSTGPLANLAITSGGAFHEVGDHIIFSDHVTGSGANGYVLTTSSTEAVVFTITNGGNGYTSNATVTIGGGSGTGASFYIANVSSDGVVSVNTDTINNFSHVVLNINSNTAFGQAGGNTVNGSANMQSANVNSILSSSFVFSDTTVGAITGIYTTNFGTGYTSLPTAQVTQENIAELELSGLGNNAIITVSHAPGSITTVSINERGSLYPRDQRAVIFNQSAFNDSLRANNVNGTVKTVNAIGTTITAGFITETGGYTDTRGFLSSNMVLQDNDYYQDFSYVIKSTLNTRDYRKVVSDILHPAGFKRFGTKLITSEIVASSIIVAETIEAITSVFILQAGTVYVANTTALSFWENDNQFFTRFANVPFLYVGSNELLYGNNTFFANSTAIIPGNTSIRINTTTALTAPTPTGNVEVRVNKVYGAGAMTLDPVFSGNSVTSYLSNSQFYAAVDIVYN